MVYGHSDTSRGAGGGPHEGPSRACSPRPSPPTVHAFGLQSAEHQRRPCALCPMVMPVPRLRGCLRMGLGCRRGDSTGSGLCVLVAGPTRPTLLRGGGRSGHPTRPQLTYKFRGNLFRRVHSNAVTSTQQLPYPGNEERETTGKECHLQGNGKRGGTGDSGGGGGGRLSTAAKGMGRMTTARA